MRVKVKLDVPGIVDCGEVLKRHPDHKLYSRIAENGERGIALVRESDSLFKGWVIRATPISKKYKEVTLVVCDEMPNLSDECKHEIEES